MSEKNNVLLHALTTVHFSKQVATAVNNITFAFDPNWNKAFHEETTLPISFYYIQDWQEVNSKQIQQKPMMFYNAQIVKNGTAQNTGVMNVVADNQVQKPKTYRAQVLLPFNAVQLTDQFQLDPTTTTEIMFMQGGVDGIDSTVTNQMAIANNILALIKLILKALSTDLSASSIASSLLGTNDINKRSLDAMINTGAILKVKTWGGWKFKYLTIIDSDLKVSSEKPQFYEGTITFSEVPIITTSAVGSVSTGKVTIAETMSKGISKMIDSLISGASKAQ